MNAAPRTVSRRFCLAYAALCSLSSTASYATSSTSGSQLLQLNAQQAQTFRSWFCAIVEDQVQRAPSPRWVHRDCAGLVRFAVRQALQNHDNKWLSSMGWPGTRPLSRDVDISMQQQKHLAQWTLQDGSRGDYASALSMVQNNTQKLRPDREQMQGGDLLFFDQGAEQHLMVWTGKRIAYHTGAPETPEDNGLRSSTLKMLMQHTDTRWRPSTQNPNFAGWFRFNFLIL